MLYYLYEFYDNITTFILCKVAISLILLQMIQTYNFDQKNRPNLAFLLLLILGFFSWIYR